MAKKNEDLSALRAQQFCLLQAQPHRANLLRAENAHSKPREDIRIVLVPWHCRCEGKVHAFSPLLCQRDLKYWAHFWEKLSSPKHKAKPMFGEKSALKILLCLHGYFVVLRGKLKLWRERKKKKGKL